MPAIASLGMYDGPGARAANDRLWARIAEQLVAEGVPHVPRTLERTRSIDSILTDPGLLFAQCCGYPLMTRYRHRLRLIGTPVYQVEGCEGTSHRSRIIVRTSDPAINLEDVRHRRAAINDRSSNTGMNLFRAAIAPLAEGRPFFSKVIITGSHFESIRAVADGSADVAAVDTVSFAHAERDLTELTAVVRTLTWTCSTPALPFVTSNETSDDVVIALRRSLSDVIQRADSEDLRSALFLSRCERSVSYERVKDIQNSAAQYGYFELR